jgi:CubicO group peptidase (beta-lactamase class C family)
MQKGFNFWAASLLILAPGLTESWGHDAQLLTADTTRQIDAVFAPWDSTHSPGCVLGVSRDGNIVYARGYGMSNLEYDVAISPESLFQIGSISKQFTAFAIALLERDGKLAFDDDIRRYLPELPDYEQKITIRHLLAHSAGFADYGFLLRRAGWRYEDNTTEGDVLGILARHKSLNFKPGAEFLYSNTAYTLLAIIVHRASGLSLREFSSRRIFAPLGMNDTLVQDDRRTIVRGRTSAYEPQPGGGWRIQLPQWDVTGASNVFTTAGDLLKWEQNLADGRVGGKALVDRMQVSAQLDDGSATSYGSGLLIHHHRGVRTIGHSGGDAGYRADAVRFPEHQLAVVTLCNLSATNPGVLNRRVAEIVLGSGVFKALAPAVSISRAEMEGVVGAYWNAHTGDAWRIRIADDRLMSDASADALVPLGMGRFRLGEQSTELRFSNSGSAATLVAGGGPPVLKPTTYIRVTAPPYSDKELQSYAGEYRNEDLPSGITIAVSPEHRLMVRRNKFDPVTLDPLMRDVFTSRGFGTVNFLRSPSGEVVGLTNGDARTRGLVYKRVLESASTCGARSDR